MASGVEQMTLHHYYNRIEAIHDLQPCNRLGHISWIKSRHHHLIYPLRFERRRSLIKEAVGKAATELGTYARSESAIDLKG